MVRFTFLTGDVNWKEYGGKFISNKLSNGEFDYYAIIEVFNWKELEGDNTKHTYGVELTVISPSQVSDEDKKRAIESWSWGEEMTTHISPQMWVDVLSSYGAGVTPVNSWNGNNITQLMKKAREEAQLCEMLFGFYMDRTVNGLGATGWDVLKDDLFPKREVEDVL